MTTVALLAMAALVSTSSLVAETPKPRDAGTAPKEMAEAFLKGIQSGAGDAAFDVLLTGSPIAEQGQQYQMLKSQTQAQLPIMGKALDFEFLSEEKVGSSVYVVKYLAKYEKDAVTWVFVFYRPIDRWMVTALRFVPTTQYLQ